MIGKMHPIIPKIEGHHGDKDLNSSVKPKKMSQPDAMVLCVRDDGNGRPGQHEIEEEAVGNINSKMEAYSKRLPLI
jgi:hypothetical protein